MKKKILYVVTASALLSMAMTGCNSTPSTPTPTPEVLTYKTAATKAVSNLSKVMSQKITYDDQWDDTVVQNYYFGADANGAMGFRTYHDSYADSVEVYKYLSNGKLVAAVDYDMDGSWVNSEANAKYFDGMEFEYGDGICGAENLISAVTNDPDGAEVKSEDYDFGATAKSEYTDPGMTYLVDAKVEFSLGENGALSTASISLTTYNNYDPETLTPDPDDSGLTIVYKVENTCGQRMTKDPYNIEQYYATSWTLEDADGNEVNNGDTITVSAGNDEALSFTFSDVAPETHTYDVDLPEFAVYQNGELLDTTYMSFDSEIGAADFFYYSLEAGEYSLKVSTALVERTLKLVVTPAVPLSFNVTNLTYDFEEYVERESTGEEYVFDGDTFEGTTFAGTPIYVMASTNPSAAGGKVVAADTEGVTIEETTVTYFYEDCDALKFTASEPGTYNITLSNDEFEDGITMTYVLTVEAAPELADVFAKKYILSDSNSGIDAEVSFTPNAEDATKGEVNIIQYEDDWDEDDNPIVVTHDNVYTYSYDAETRLFDLTLKSGTDKDNEDWEVPTFGLTSRMLPAIDSQECIVDTVEARLEHANYAFHDYDPYQELEDTTGYVAYKVTFDEGDVKLRFRDFSAAKWTRDEEGEYYYDGVDEYIYVIDEDGYTLEKNDDGYVVKGNWELSYSNVDEEERKSQDQIFTTLTVLSAYNCRKLTVKTVDSSFTLDLN